MTTDERLNDLEDEIKKLKQTINHNNKVSRGLNESINTKLTNLNTAVEALKTQSTARNAGMGDIFGSGFPGSGR